jgi:hypothetical protein
MAAKVLPEGMFGVKKHSDPANEYAAGIIA